MPSSLAQRSPSPVQCRPQDNPLIDHLLQLRRIAPQIHTRREARIQRLLQRAHVPRAGHGWVRQRHVLAVDGPVRIGAHEVRVALPHARHEDGDFVPFDARVLGRDIFAGADEDDFAVFGDDGLVFERVAFAGDEDVGDDSRRLFADGRSRLLVGGVSRGASLWGRRATRDQHEGIFVS